MGSGFRRQLWHRRIHYSPAGPSHGPQDFPAQACFGITADGLPGDPVNVRLAATLQQLCAAFATADWSEADKLFKEIKWCAHAREELLDMT